MSFYVYHIHLEGMGITEGYIGISKNPKERFASHKRGQEDSLVHRAIVKYKDKIRFKIIEVCDTLQDALWTEFCLRPLPKMGWNIAAGGGMPPDSSGSNNPNFGKVTSKETREKQSKARVGKFCGKNHPRARLVNIFTTENVCIAEKVVIRVWAKENNYHQGHLVATAKGKLKQHKGIYARYV